MTPAGSGFTGIRLRSCATARREDRAKQISRRQYVRAEHKRVITGVECASIQSIARPGFAR